MPKYVDKIETLMILRYGGLSREALKVLPDVSNADIDEAIKRLASVKRRIQKSKEVNEREQGN